MRLFLAGLLWLVLGLPVQAAPPVPFKVGIAAPTVNMLPLWMAQSLHLFEAKGLRVEIVDTDGGSRGLAQVGGGQLDAMIVGLSAVIDANGKGGDYRLIASGANTMSFRFFGARSVTSAAALRAKRVGISALGSESDSAARLALRALGLGVGDVTLIQAGGTLARLALLQSGQIAATALNEPADTEASAEGLPLLVDLKADLPWIFTAIAVDRASLVASRETVKTFLRAYIEGLFAALADEGRAKKVLGDAFKQFPAAVIDAAYADFKARVPRDAMPSPEGARNMLEELPQMGMAVKSRDVRDYIDATLIEELGAEGFFSATRSNYGVP